MRLRNSDHVDIVLPVRDASSTALPSSDTSRAGSRWGSRRRDLTDAAVIAAPGVAVAGSAVTDIVRDSLLLDESMLDALTELSGTQVDGLADFLTLQELKNCQLESIRLRGTVGEQQAASSFNQAGHEVTWPQGGATEFGPSNNPGWDFQVDGHEVNVKVTQDASDAAASHFAQHPDVPMVVNADAANIAPDAVYFDPAQGLDAASLDGDNVTIVDESLILSDIASLQADVAGIDGTADIEAAADTIPGLTLLTAAGRSGVREGRLARNGKTSPGRAVKNVGLDTSLKGGGAAAGATAGAKAGLAIDAMTGGALLGVPTLFGSVGGRSEAGMPAAEPPDMRG